LNGHKVDVNLPLVASGLVYWINTETYFSIYSDTSPSLMVVGGDTEKEYLDGHFALSFVQLLSSYNDFCQIEVSNVTGEAIQDKEVDQISGQIRIGNETDLAGLTGK
jgi:hypothetical protein